MKLRLARLGMLVLILAGCNETPGLFNGSYDSTAPTLALSTPAANDVLPGYTSATGQCDPGSTIAVAGDVSSTTPTVSCDSSKTFSIPFRLTDGAGAKNLVLTATAANGNVTTKTVSVTMPPASLKGVNAFEPCNNYYGQYYWPGDQPTIQWDLDYFKSRGLTLVRLNLPWESLQPTLNGPLTPWMVACVHYVIDQAHARNMSVLLDLHNYARYLINNGGGSTDYSSVPASDIKLLGSSDVPNTAFQNVWTRMATEFNAAPGLYGYGLMNEPHDMPDPTQWPTSAQAAVTAIRTVDTTTPIVVAGDGWSGASGWTANNGTLSINDPSNNIIYEAHVYFDSYGAGQYTGTYDSYSGYPQMGVDAVKPFVDWITQHHYHGLIGEFGVPGDDPRWLTVLDNFASYVAKAGIDTTAWAAGYMWEPFGHTNVWFNIEPVGGLNRPSAPVDRPAMTILQKYPSTH